MLLLHGDRLTGARFSVTGKAVSITKSQISSNGHYAFLWLDEDRAAPQIIHIRITAPSGSASVAWTISRRSSAPHSGFSSSDVMYLVMTDRFADGDPSNDPQPAERDQPRGWHGGDFRGLQQHLDYLQQLGVTTLWTTPVYDNDGGTPGVSRLQRNRPLPHRSALRHPSTT